MHPWPFIQTARRPLAVLFLLWVGLIGGGGPARAAADRTAQIINYLLGKSSDPSGLDLNSDGGVNVADIVYGITRRAPVVTSFAIAGGAASTATRTVTLNNACSGSPSEYMASESSTFSGAVWRPYLAAPSFTLGTGNLTKTVYFKVRTAFGVESAVASDSIVLTEIVPLTVGAAAVSGAITPAGDCDWYRFSVTATSTYVIETWPGTLTDNYMRLFGPGNMTTLISQNHNSSVNNTARIARTLAPGTYYVKTQAYAAAGTGTYTIRVTNIGALKVNTLMINSGGASATSRHVTLNNTCSGAPTQFMASESSTFSGSAWQTYSAAAAFTLSAGNLKKTVYFKVRDGGGAESPAVNASVTLAEVTSLSVGASAVTGTLSPAGESDWFKFTASATSTFDAVTAPGTLTDFTMALYGPGNMTALIATDHDSGTAQTPRIARTLAAGTYYLKIQAVSASATGNYTIKVADLGALKVKSFSIDGGAGTATQTTVTLNNACAGAPVKYMASESSSFTGASWLAYSAAPSFRLSTGNGEKKVYFKVQDAGGTVSSAVNDKIMLTVMTPLTTNGIAVGGEIKKTDQEDWYTFTVKTAGLYTVQTYAGSLNDTYMGLAKIPNPGSSDWLATNDNISQSDLTSRITAYLTAGQYYVLVMSPQNLTGTYSIAAFQPPSTRLTLNGAALSDTLATESDDKWYQFTVTASGFYSIETAAGTLDDAFLELFSNGSTRIAWNDDRTEPQADKMPAITAFLASGTYIIRLTSYNNQYAGTYTIKVRSGAIAGEEVALMIDGPTASGTIQDYLQTGVADLNTFQIVVTQNGSFSIASTAGSLKNGVMKLYYLDPANKYTPVLLTGKASNGSGKMPVIDGVNLITGTYQVTIQGETLADYGSYQIKVYQ